MKRANNAIFLDTERTDVDHLQAAMTDRLAAVPRDVPLALVVHDAAQAIGVVAWLQERRQEGLVVEAQRWTDALREAAAAKGFHAVDIANGTLSTAERRPMEPEALWLLTSGTTGEPKWVRHDWDSILTAPTDLPPRHWLVTYQTASYAWYQLVTLGLLVPGQTLTFAADRDPARQLSAAAANGVDAISATPTFWRVAMMAGEGILRRVHPSQITLGGERVDQSVIDLLARFYPDARISHIYASTEAGAAIVVHDGQAGFPVAWLTENPIEGRPGLRVKDGKLWVRSPKAGAGYGDWFDTQDRVEQVDGRIHILGRVDGAFVKVGGASVDLRHVESVLLSHPSILWCRVIGRSAPLVGTLLSAQYVATPGLTVDEKELTAFAAGRLSEHMVPRFWQPLTEIPTTANLKTELA